jgi:hypothetical protein
VDQATLDRITFDTYVDCGRNATAAAKQLGCSPSTVTRRVRRHSLVATAAESCSHEGTPSERRRPDATVEFSCATCGHVFTHSQLVARREAETAEVGRHTYRCTSKGIKVGGTWVVGPVLADVVIWQRTDPTGKRSYRPIYTVEVDGVHLFGGEVDHLVGRDVYGGEGVPASTTLTGWYPGLLDSERADAAIASAKAVTSDVQDKLDATDVPAKAARRNAKREGAKARIARLAHTDPNEPRPLVCSVCGKDIATDGVSTGGAYYCPKHAPAQRKPRARTSGSSATEGPPPRCPGGGQVGLDGPGSTRCPVCTQDAASVRRDGTLGSHKLLRPRQAVTS